MNDAKHGAKSDSDYQTCENDRNILPMNSSATVPDFITIFVEYVTHIQILDRILDELFENPTAKEIMNTTAHRFWYRMKLLTVNSLLTDLSLITEHAETGKHQNLTVEYIIKTIEWTNGREQEAQEILTKCKGFYGKLKDGRNKRLAHNDLDSCLSDRAFPLPSDIHKRVIKQLQSLIDLAYAQHGELSGGPVTISVPGDVIDFRKTLGTPRLYERVLKDPRLPRDLKNDMSEWEFELSRQMDGQQPSIDPVQEAATDDQHREHPYSRSGRGS